MKLVLKYKQALTKDLAGEVREVNNSDDNITKSGDRLTRPFETTIKVFSGIITVPLK